MTFTPHTSENGFWLPKCLSGSLLSVTVSARDGGLLADGYAVGDRLQVCLGVPLRDNDPVLVESGDDCHVRTFMSDEDGRPWLVRLDGEGDAVSLGQADVRVLGVVLTVEQQAPRASAAACLKAVQRARSGAAAFRQLTPQQLDDVLRAVAPEVRHGRLWYAVWRALLDREQYAATDLSTFCQRVRQQLPDHPFPPVPKEVGRMAVLSFAKPVASWTSANAPVHGTFFQDYLSVARLTLHLLDRQLL